MTLAQRSRDLHLAAVMDQVVGDQAAGGVNSDGRRAWTLSFDNGTSVRIRAVADRGWLVLRASPGSTAAAEEMARFLVWNAELEGGARFALAPGERMVHLRADVPLDPATDLPAAVAEACAGIRHGHALLGGLPSTHSGAHHSGTHRASRHGSRCGPPDGALRPRPTRDVIAVTCRETGWPTSLVEGGPLTVEIGEVGARAKARVAIDDSGVRVTTSFGHLARGNGSCREATALLLLRACDVVRLARGVMTPCRADGHGLVDGEKGSGDGVNVGFEVLFSVPPSREALARCLGALTVAHELCRREVDLLQTAKVAGEFLRVGGPSPLRGPALSALE